LVLNLNHLSLFTGGGGGEWGAKLLDWTTIGYVEIDDYCQRVIRQRILDGYFDEAPIFSDIRAFISEGYAESYQGLVDVLSAGFPCQPFSVAGKQAGESDERNLWPETIECIRIIRPRFAFLENVPGLLAHRYIQRIFGDLAESGYDCRWKVISAAEVGAPHKRDRLWILAYSEQSGWPGLLHGHKASCLQPRWQNGSLGNVRTTDETILALEKMLGESAIFRIDDGMANRVNRLKALGNGQVPQCMAAAWNILTGDWFTDSLQILSGELSG